MMMGLMYTDAAHLFLDQQEKMSKPEGEEARSGKRNGQQQQMVWGASGRAILSSFSSKLFLARQDNKEDAGEDLQESPKAE